MKNRFVPIIIAVSLVIGIVVGTFIASRFSGNRLSIINTSSNKLNDLLHIIDEQYVDTIHMSDLVEGAMPEILGQLDPHSSYIPAADAVTANDDLRGSFSGIGVQFTIRQDTVCINNVIHGGPSERVGIMPGDRIISVDGEDYVGKDIVSNEETMHRLKGEKNSKVRLEILRHGERKSFTITRGDIPVYSIDATFMIPDTDLGYIRVRNFGDNTYPELLMSLATLEQADFKGLVVDLRGNGGGYLGAAIQLANEFLPADRLIVYTEGRKAKRENYKSDGRGSYQRLPLIVLTDESTASAAEIFAGAIQDNDRGIIVGRRSFGKGLVQQPFEFSDGSLIHLTVARYYTPSGRCIQKPYELGHSEDYEMDLVQRFNHGEFFTSDSIAQGGPEFTTRGGRVVYGGGGIMPDYFVAEDTTLITPYYTEAVTRGYLLEFAWNYADRNRSVLSTFKTADELAEHLRGEHLVEQFVHFADSRGMVRRNNQIRQSRTLFEQVIYGNVIYNLMEMDDYLRYINQTDPTVLRAIELFEQNLTVPVLSTGRQNPVNTKAGRKAAFINDVLRTHVHFA